MKKPTKKPANKNYDVVFRFTNENLMKDFMGWMSDGGGEQYFMTDENEASFDYHSANKGTFGPVVLVSGKPRKKRWD